MNERRFFDPNQPQTLQTAVFLAYIGAVFDLLNVGVFGPIMLLFAAGLAAGAFGVANEARWGYMLALVTAATRVAWLLGFYGSQAFDFPVIISLLFDGALVALLVHPMSRDYQRIWFK